MNKKIVLFTAEFPFGQQETFLENELGYLARAYERVIIVPLFKHKYEREINYSNVVVYTPVNNSREVTIHKLVLFLSKTFWFTLFLGVIECRLNPSCYLKAIKQAFIIARLKKYLRKRPELYDNDLWYFYWGTNAVNVLPFLPKIPKVVARYHRYDLYGKDVDGGELQLFQKQTLNKTTKAIFISDHGLEYARSLYNEYGHKMVISRLGVPERGTSNPSLDGTLRILTCSNLYEVKRVHLLAKALMDIKDIKIEWVHIGDGQKKVKNHLLNMVKNLPENIVFKTIGRVKNSEIVEYYQDNPIDLFINVSVSEGLPVSIMEAFSFGVPVIATEVGGTAELVNSENGFLLHQDFEVSELTHFISKFYRKYYGDMKFRSRAKLSWSNFVDANSNYQDFIKLLNEVIGDSDSSNSPMLKLLKSDDKKAKKPSIH